jgi:hypothetical protein
MSYFEQKLDLLLEKQVNVGYYDPDYLYDIDSIQGITFLYMDGKVLADHSHISHWDMIEENLDLLYLMLQKLPEDYMIKFPGTGFRINAHDIKVDVLDKHPEMIQPILSYVRDDLEKFILFGRSGPIEPDHGGFQGALEKQMPNELPLYFVTFWQAPPDLNVTDCVKQVSSINNYADDPIWISAPSIGTVPFGQHEDRRDLDQEEIAKIQMQRRLHLMKADEKKAAMKKLGLATGGAKSPGQRAGLTPGQKYWAMSSEGKE